MTLCIDHIRATCQVATYFQHLFFGLICPTGWRLYGSVSVFFLCIDDSEICYAHYPIARSSLVSIFASGDLGTHQELI